MGRPRTLTDEQRIENRKKTKRESMKRYRDAHPEEYRTYMREYKRSHPQKLTPDQHRQKRWAYKAKLKEAPRGYVNIKKLKEEWNKLCGICKEVVEGAFDIDHIVPLSLGGAHSQENLQLTHPFCNRSKGNRI